MKVGDLVRIIGSFAEGERICVIIALNKFSEGWHILLCNSRQVTWPESQLEVINECR